MCCIHCIAEWLYRAAYLLPFLPWTVAVCIERVRGRRKA